MDVEPSLRVVASGHDLDAWARLKSAVVPNEPVTAEQIHATDEDGRLLLLAELDGKLIGCGIAARSHFAGRGFVAPRVLPDFRRRGVGTSLLLALSDHVRSLGREELISFVYADEPESVAFAERFRQNVVDYQLEQIRLIGAEEHLPPPEDIEIVPLAGRREELLRAAWPVALEGYADMPLPGDVSFDLEEWLRDEATRPEGSFVALERGEVVGYAGLLEHANGSAMAEHGLTAVRRDRRRRGIAHALKRAQLEWAARTDLVQLVTWTQKGNEGMQAINRSLGYVDHARVLTFTGPLPSHGRDDR
jgi:GNAT superfamily N-acetyltransferase